ncbi:MAG: tetratricopeptide repeat protein, partial [Myxococcales bacterium]|nr:tetratricopeptide repeat protein [Myxococcales bacterium]
PERDYGRTIELLDRLVTTWPDARGIDGAHYLMGYCLAETGRGDAALAAFTTLVERYPDSRFAAETWTRIGEHHFEAGDLDAALAAYERVLGYKDSPYYDKALYKLAWTHYRLDRYPQAIDRFRELIEFSDDQVARTGKGESALRDEAIEYLAASIQEEDWDGDGEPDPDAGLPRVLAHVTGERPYDAELLRAIVDTLHANTRYDDAIAVARHLLDRFPLDPQNPAVHARLIAAQERLQKTADAFAERDRLAALYGQGTPWHRANQDDPDALAAAARLMEQAILEAATWHHARAQALRPDGEAGDAAAADEARREYALAAVGYQNYLAQYPDAQNAYQIGWFAADALFYAGRYADAAAAYAAVRDDDRGTEYTEPAAFSAILAREQEVRRLIAEGRLDPRPSLLDAPPAPPEAPAAGAEPEDDGALRVIQPEPIPPPVAELIAAREAWLDRGLTNEAEPERGAVIAYKAGETWFDYRHHDNARKWFAWVLQRHPGSELARLAAANIIDTFRQTNDWQKMAEWAEIIADAGLGRDFDAEIDTLKVGALFKAAERLFADERYEEAAAEYIRLVAENPDNRYADAALNNAAVAYEKTRRFESATRTYERIYRDYPQSEYAEKALYRVGVNAERFYDFDRAIATHLQLVDDYPDSESRADALYRAALLLERTRRYREAAAAYERYAALFPDREDTAETFFRAARVYQKLDDTPGQIRIYDTFVRRYGQDPAHNARVVEGLAAIAALHEAAGRTRDARAAWQRVIDEFDRRGMTPGTYEAQHPARARFELVEDDFERYRALRLEGALRAQRATLTEMQNQVKALTAAYAEVLPYKSFEWTLATLYRLGHIYQLLAEALYNAPMPAGLSDDEVDVYRTQLEDIALVIEDEAVKRYEQAFEKARELRVTNAWTRRILQSLNKYKPGDYPLFKEERRVVAERLLTPPRLLAGSDPPATAPAPGTPATPGRSSAPAEPGDEK